MTGWRKRQVIELAERASPSRQDWWKDDDALEAFAELVREDEREAINKEAKAHLEELRKNFNAESAELRLHMWSQEKQA